MVTRTVLETTIRVVCRTLSISAQIVPFDFDVVPLCLMPDEHLFRSLHTFTFVVLAPHSWVRLSDRLWRRRIRDDLGSEGEEIDVRDTIAIGNL